MNKKLQAFGLSLGLAGCASEELGALIDPSEAAAQNSEKHEMSPQAEEVHRLLNETPAGCHVRNSVALTLSVAAGIINESTIIHGPGFGGLPQGSDQASMHNFTGPHWNEGCFEGKPSTGTYPIAEPIQFNEDAFPDFLHSYLPPKRQEASAKADYFEPNQPISMGVLGTQFSFPSVEDSDGAGGLNEGDEYPHGNEMALTLH